MMLTDQVARRSAMLSTQRGTGMGVVEVLESADTPEWCDASYLAMKTGMVTLPASSAEVDAAVKTLITFFVRKFSLAPDWQNGAIGWSRDELLAACRARAA